MASYLKDPAVGSVNNDNSPIMERAIAVGKTVADLVKESERSGEARARFHLTSKIDDLRCYISDLKLMLQACEEENAEFKEELKAAEKRTAEAEAKAKVDADARVAQHTSDLEARNAQMVETVAEAVEKIKRDAAARVAAAETHAQACIDEYRDKTNSQIRQLSRDLERHIDMLGLARKHTGWVAHKLNLLSLELEQRKGLPDKTLLANCLKKIVEELGEYRNECDGFLDNGLMNDGEPDWGPVPDDEGGALLNGLYGKSSRVTSANNTEERSNQPQAPVSPSGKDTPNEQASREQNSLFVDDQQSGRSDQSCTIKSEDRDNNQQTLTDSSQSTKRASDSGGQTRRGGKRQRTK